MLLSNICIAQQPDFEVHRRQYEKQIWQVYQTAAYDVYYTKGADTLVAEVLLEIQDVLQEIEDSLFTSRIRKLNIILYPTIASLQESNIGISADRVLPIGSKRFTGNRVLLAYKGNRTLLRADLKEKILDAYIQQRIYGKGLKAFLKSANESRVPNWFKRSVPTFYSHGWTVERDLVFKNILLIPKKKTFVDLIEQEPQLSGMALLYYLSKTQRKGTLSNLIFMVLKGKSLAQSAQLVYKKPLWKLQQNALLFFVNRYLNDNSKPFSSLAWKESFKLPKEILKSQSIEVFKTSPELNKAVVLAKGVRSYSVYVYHFDSKEPYKLLSVPIQEVFQEPNIPVLAWGITNRGVKLGISYHDKGQLIFREYFFKKEIKPYRTTQLVLKEVDAINEISFSQDRQVYFSANKAGMCDVYLLKGNSLRRITYSKNEEGGLLFGSYQGKQGLFFTASYRGDTVYINKAMNQLSKKSNLYFLDTEKIEILWHQSKPYVIPIVVRTGDQEVANASYKQHQEALYYSFLESGYQEVKSNKSGVECVYRNKKAFLDYKPMGDSIYTFHLQGDVIQRSTVQQQKQVAVKSIAAMEFELAKKRKLQKAIVEHKKKNKLNLFGPDQQEVKRYQDSLLRAKYFNPKRSNPYKLKLLSDYTSASLNNSLLINRYQPYQFNQGLFHQAKVGGLIQYAFSDLFENYRVAAGVRLPANGNGSDFFLSYENRKRLLDWGGAFLRHVEKFSLPNNSKWFAQGGVYFPPYIRQKTNYLEGYIRYPFSKSQALKMSMALRHDRQVFIANDTFSLFYPDTTQLWSLGRLSYQLDRSKKILEDIRTGFRGQFFFEYHAQLAQVQTSFMHLGLDLRYYLPIYKNMIWANRLQAASSGGETNGIMYTLGGTQNQLAPQVDSQANFLPTDNYSLIAYATGLRGYAQNVRFGNTYTLLNSEIRVPILNTFFNIQTRLNALNKLKLILFVDVANAWNREKISWDRTPQWTQSYGVGLHTNLLNYQIRMDVAWQNLQQNNVKTPLIMFSLGQNF